MQQPSGMTAERALARLRQLAREEAAAVDAGDVTGLCRAAKLLRPAMSDYVGSGPVLTPEVRQTIAEIQRAHACALEFLRGRLDEVSGRLRQSAAAKRLRKSYALSAQSSARGYNSAW